jgi:hypothetical protein
MTIVRGEQAIANSLAGKLKDLGKNTQGVGEYIYSAKKYQQRF